MNRKVGAHSKESYVIAEHASPTPALIKSVCILS